MWKTFKDIFNCSGNRKWKIIKNNIQNLESINLCFSPMDEPIAGDNVTRCKALLCNAIGSETPVSQGWEEAAVL